MNVGKIVKGLIYSGAYVLSFLLPSLIIQGSPLEGYRAFFAATADPFMLFYFLLGIGNIFMVMAVFSLIFPVRNKLIQSGLTAQSVLMIILMFSHFPLLTIGFYVWMGSQIAMCFLFWERDVKIDDVENSKNFILVLACSFLVVLLTFIWINQVKQKEEDNQRIITQQNNQSIKKSLEVQAVEVAQCEDNEKKKLNSSSVSGFQSAFDLAPDICANDCVV